MYILKIKVWDTYQSNHQRFHLWFDWQHACWTKQKQTFLIWRINKHRLYMRKGLMLFFLHLYEIKIISSIFFLRKCCGVKVSKCCNNAHVFQNAPFILWKLLSAWNAALITSRHPTTAPICTRLKVARYILHKKKVLRKPLTVG